VGLENVEQIAAVPGVDCLCIGFMDLSNFLGVPGELEHPTYLAAVDRIVQAATKHRRVLAIAAPTDSFAQEYLARGFQLIFFGPDVLLLQSALSQRIRAVRS
jgi:2-dehydro-3-deoxyglucarate aldolase/4-hydroxy-2-oxoheptanedioate aldolase